MGGAGLAVCQHSSVMTEADHLRVLLMKELIYTWHGHPRQLASMLVILLLETISSTSCNTSISGLPVHLRKCVPRDAIVGRNPPPIFLIWLLSGPVSTMIIVSLYII